MEPSLLGTSFKKRSMKLPNIMKTESNICGEVSTDSKKWEKFVNQRSALTIDNPMPL